jgi:hypothetical protein
MKIEIITDNFLYVEDGLHNNYINNLYFNIYTVLSKDKNLYNSLQTYNYNIPKILKTIYFWKYKFFFNLCKIFLDYHIPFINHIPEFYKYKYDLVKYCFLKDKLILDYISISLIRQLKKEYNVKYKTDLYKLNIWE